MTLNLSGGQTRTRFLFTSKTTVEQSVIRKPYQWARAMQLRKLKEGMSIQMLEIILFNREVQLSIIYFSLFRVYRWVWFNLYLITLFFFYQLCFLCKGYVISCKTFSLMGKPLNSLILFPVMSVQYKLLSPLFFA